MTTQGRTLDQLKPEGDLAVNLSELNLVANSSQDEWYVDSGASKHVTGSKDLLSNLAIGSSSRISTTGGEKLAVAGKGNIEISAASLGVTSAQYIS